MTYSGITLKACAIFLAIWACSLIAQKSSYSDDEAMKKAENRYFEFALHGALPYENFVAVTSDSAVISMAEQQLALPIEERHLHINGAIDYGNGGHNLDWSWHFIPDQWILTQFSIEICDGNPSYVELDLYYWIEELGYFCPWTSYVLREITDICGDANHDSVVAISDAIWIINFVFAGGDPPQPYESGDCNCDGTVNVSDGVWIINYVFSGGYAPCDIDGDGNIDC